MIRGNPASRGTETSAEVLVEQKKKHLKYFEGQIQALVHWRSEDSTRIYMDRICQVNAREKVSFTVTNANSLPRIDPVAYKDQHEIILPDVVRMPSQSLSTLIHGHEREQLTPDRPGSLQRSERDQNEIILHDVVRIASQINIDA